MESKGDGNDMEVYITFWLCGCIPARTSPLAPTIRSSRWPGGWVRIRPQGPGLEAEILRRGLGWTRSLPPFRLPFALLEAGP